MKANRDDRLVDIEETLRQLSRRIEQQEAQRAAETTPPVGVRIGKTWTETEGDYPTDADTELYPFVFLGADSSASPPTYTERSADKQGDALWPDERYLPRGTKIAVGEDKNGTYFIAHAWYGATLVQGVLAADLASGTATVDIESISSLDGFPPELTASKLNVENRFKFSGTAGDLVLAQYDARNKKWFLLQMVCLAESA